MIKTQNSSWEAHGRIFAWVRPFNVDASHWDDHGGTKNRSSAICLLCQHWRGDASQISFRKIMLFEMCCSEEKKAPAGTPKRNPGFLRKKKAPAGTPKRNPGFWDKKKAPAGTPKRNPGFFFRKKGPCGHAKTNSWLWFSKKAIVWIS